MTKKQNQRDTAEKNCFGSGLQGHQEMMRFEKRRQRKDETIEKFLDDLEKLKSQRGRMFFSWPWACGVVMAKKG